MLSLLFIAKVVCCKSAVVGRVINVKMSGFVWAFAGLISNPKLCLLPLVRKVVKEMIGFEIDPEFLLILFTGYLFQAIRMLSPGGTVKRIKHRDEINYPAPEDTLNLAS